MPVNIDGAIAAVCGDIGIPPEIANALFIISRVPGIAAHAQEERQREHPMRQIDPKDTSTTVRSTPAAGAAQIGLRGLLIRDSGFGTRDWGLFTCRRNGELIARSAAASLYISD